MERLDAFSLQTETQPILTIAEQIADKLRDEIISSEIEPGTPIRQSHIADRFDVSQAPVREALGHLAAEGLVEYHSNRGVRVAKLHRDVVCEIAQIRILIETDMVKRATKNFASRNETLAKIAIESAAKADTTLKQLASDKEFHSAIYQSAEQPITLEVLQRLRTRYVQYLGYMWKYSDHAPASLNDHKQLLSLMVNGKASEAASFLRRHIDASTNAIIMCMPKKE